MARLVATVRFRVTALATLVVLAVLVTTGVGLVAAQSHLLTSNLDDALGRRSDELAALLRAGQDPARLVGGEEDSLAQIVTPGGEVVAATPALAGRSALAPSPGDDEAIRTVHDLPPDEQSFRVMSRLVNIEGTGPLVLHVAGALDDIEENVRILGASLTVVVPLVAAFLAAVVWWLVGRILRPVESIRTEASAMTGEDMARRLPEPPGDDEIARLARTMNAMLDRVEAASARQRSFIADASHELRSPLTRIRSEIEVDMAHPERARLEATHRSVLDEVDSMQRLVDDLLHLARSEAGATVGHRLPVDLDDVVLTQARRLRTRGGVAVDTSGIGPAQVLGDAEQLSRAVANLADNAARHAATTVTFTVEERDGWAVVAVSDDGPGIPPDQRERIFERFARLDDSRTAGVGGTGLGLAISRDIVSHHGGWVEVDADHSPGARFVVSLPL